MDRAAVAGGLSRADADFQDLVARAPAKELRARSAGTRWTNRQLMFHMVFGFLIVRTLMPLVHLLGRLGWSQRFAAVLNLHRGPLHVINYLGSVGGGQFCVRRRWPRYWTAACVLCAAGSSRRRGESGVVDARSAGVGSVFSAHDDGAGRVPLRHRAI